MVANITLQGAYVAQTKNKIRTTTNEFKMNDDGELNRSCHQCTFNVCDESLKSEVTTVSLKMCTFHLQLSSRHNPNEDWIVQDYFIRIIDN